MAARFQSQRVGEVFGKLLVGEHFFQNSCTLVTLQTFEGRDKNFGCGLRCAHVINVADFGQIDKSEGKKTTEDLPGSIFSQFCLEK